MTLYVREVPRPSHPLMFVAVALAAILAGACSGDHDRLAKGEGGSGGSVTGSGGETTSTSSGGGGSGGDGGIVEPPGPTRLTVVNGVVDHDAVRFCFLPYPDSSGSTVLPWPGVEGLPFARGAPIEPDEAVPFAGDVELVIMAGTLAATGGKDCVELVQSTPAGVELSSIGVLPASVLDEQKSLLLVANGCLGGPGHSHEQEASACGPGYSESAPNVSVLAGFMSRLPPEETVSMQFAQASLALPALRLRVLPADGTASALAVDSWSPGAIAPFPPMTSLSKLDIQPVDQAQLALYNTSSSEPIHSASWASALANSTLSSADVVDGQGLVFIAVGASWELGAGPWWHEYTYTVVAADP